MVLTLSIMALFIIHSFKRGRERERDRERKREREKETERETSGLSQSVRFFSLFFPLILFHVMGLVLQRRNGTEKNTLLLLLSNIITNVLSQLKLTQ